MTTQRLLSWLDPGSAVVLTGDEQSGVHTARGTLAGVPIMLYVAAPDRSRGGLQGLRCRDVVAAIDLADRENVPVIGLWCLDEMDAAGSELSGGLVHVYAAMMSVSGRVPQILTVIGPATGGVAACIALADVAVSVNGADGHLDVTSEQDAQAATARILRLLTGTAAARHVAIDRHDDLRKLLPLGAKRSYDVKPLVRALLDEGRFDELRPVTAPNIVVGLGSLGGRPVGVVANNPRHRWGILDAAAAGKAAAFVRTCDSFSVPLLVIVDVPAFLPGIGRRWGDVLRTGAELLHTFAETSVPRAALITREAYHGAYFVTKACSMGETTVYAWPETGADAAVDEVIDPGETRMKLAGALVRRPVWHERIAQ